jgi:hypothetical protein
MVKVPRTAPTIVGLNVTLIVQLAPAARVAPQVPPDLVNTAFEKLSAILVKIPPDRLVKVTGKVLLDALDTLPKASVVGATDAAGPLWTNSTAPASIPVPEGLGLP